MCGIASIYNYHYASPPIQREELQAIRDLLRLRGPDGEGEWYSACGRVAMGHRRLSIIDLSEQGAQPMVDESGQVVLSFNGEIYNHKALRSDLERRGSRFRGSSDTEVLLNLYLQEGDAFLGRLRGMFALSLWDGRERCLKLARDTYGIKPLYYADDGWKLRVASQVKALTGSRLVSHDKEPAGLAGFFLTGSVPEPFTIYREIRQLPAGTWMSVDERGLHQPRPFGSVQSLFASAGVPGEEPKSVLREALQDSVRHHLISDVPVAIFLSAGIDSQSIAALAAREGRADLRCLTLTFGGSHPDVKDEAQEAARFCADAGLTHATACLDEVDLRASMMSFLDAMDQPTIDGVNVFFISRAVRRAGYKVALSGIGGDELFGGYPSFTDLPYWKRLLAIPSRIPAAAPVYRHASATIRRLIGRGSPKIDGLLTYGRDLAGAYFLKRGLFMPWELPGLIGKEMAVEGLRRLGLAQRIAATLEGTPRDDRSRIACLESALYLRNQLLRDADWAGMAHSVEVRTPLVDSALTARLAAYLRGSAALGKKDLAEAAGVTSDRPKTGFTPPLRAWIESERALPEWKEADRKLGRTQHWSRRWAYAVYRRHVR